VLVVTMDWSDTPEGPVVPPERRILHANGVRWWTEPDRDDPDPAFHSYWHLYADRRLWQRACIDDLLRAVADETMAEVFLTDVGLRRLYHPYDGGADIIVSTPDERDRLRRRHSDWLSSYPSGL